MIRSGDQGQNASFTPEYPVSEPPRNPDAMMDAVLRLAGEARRQGQLGRARQVCYEAVTRIWANHRGTVGLPIASAPPAHSSAVTDESGLAAVEALVSACSGRDVVWITHLVGNTYTHMLPSDLRSETGAFYTPPALVALAIEQCLVHGLDLTSARCIDPAAGAGAFLVSLATRMADTMSVADDAFVVRAIGSRLHGLELDPFAAWMANVFIELAVIDQVRSSGRRLKPVVIAENSLEANAGHGYDLVIGNPPFGRVRLSDRMRTRYADGLYGHANLYGLFMHAAVEMTVNGGMIALITPTSYLGGQYFTNLRKLMADRAPPVAFELVTQRRDVFRDVLQETAISFFRKGGQVGKVAVSLATVDVTGVVSGRVGEVQLPSEPGAPWHLPRTIGGVFLAERMSRMSARLAEWGYRVKTGPLVWNRHKTEIAAAADGQGLPIIWAEAVRSDGLVCLEYAKRDDKARIAPDDRNAWLVTNQPCVLLQRTTAKEQSRRLVAGQLHQAFLDRYPRGVVVENHVNMLVPTRAEPAVPIEVLAAFINTSAADQVYRCISGSVAVSAYELENMPLPSPASMTAFADAVMSGDIALMETEARLLYGEQP
ncbi:MAG: SAM-dependent methyltransferase [Citromicrobium sp.]|nr:MAG: SAM-dependent methyltransferase [Citromicrobium sp.]